MPAYDLIIKQKDVVLFTKFIDLYSVVLQIVEKDGRYFSLNNTRLQVCQWLETRGHLSTVQAETVPLTAVPEGIKRWMLAPPLVSEGCAAPGSHCHGGADNKMASSSSDSAEERVMTITYEPMERRPHNATDDFDDEDHSDSDDTDCDESDSSPDEFELRDQQHRRRRQSEESGHEEDASLL
ncbi:hypothetical protein PoB_006980300 [Plakobranchus ocellatus]|uniref:Uncharacterized protein n=1 Tax=Plakobranchus ocellatus TaxID=259542 RepID=A0AAV4DGW5_9GAST|nr:hypothetical protein PoB_006980300 [Plakobranchus ocellatus]